MKIHWLQHAPFEGLGTIADWLGARGHAVAGTRLYAGETPPAASAYDWLIVMGGPMNIYQYRDHPWLRPEKKAIAEAVAAGRRVLGVCLGAQLLADVLGSKVYQNAEREIGWFPVKAVAAGAASPFAFPAQTTVFHWHGDTFDLPPETVWLARSEACAHQAFARGTRLLGLQFHGEMTAPDMAELAEACAAELTTGRYVQSAAQLAGRTPEPAATKLLESLLVAMERG